MREREERKEREKERKSHWVFKTIEMEKKSTAPRWTQRMDRLKREEEAELSGSLCWEFNGKSEMMEGFGSIVRAELKFACQCHQLINRNPKN